MNRNEFISAKEAIAILAIPTSTFFKRVKEGKIPSYRNDLTDKMVFRRDEIEAIARSSIRPNLRAAS